MFQNTQTRPRAFSVMSEMIFFLICLDYFKSDTLWHDSLGDDSVLWYKTIVVVVVHKLNLKQPFLLKTVL